MHSASTHAEKNKAPERRFKSSAKAHRKRLDCSHFVNYIYQKAHLPYPYASSEELYVGVDSFQRVFNPMPGDLIVWRGHVGIVTDPYQTRFVSVLRSGVKADNYLSNYWKRRGKPRFLRYAGIQTAERVASFLPSDRGANGD
jgi:cell wall-associated NlpC family hydrolase